MKFIRIIFFTIIILSVFLAIALGVIYESLHGEKKTLTDAIQKAAGGNYVQLTDGVTHHQLGGPDTGQVVVLIHGFSVPYYIWDPTYDYLVKQGFRVLRYDEFGRGFSDRPNIDYTRDVYFRQLTELISKLKLRTPVSLAGVSFGGEIATDFAGDHPEMVDKIILVDPAYVDSKPGVPAFITRYNMDIHPNDRAKAQMTDFKHPENYPDWVKKYKVQMEYKGFTHALVSTEYNYAYNARERNTLLNTKNKPVLLIWGRYDQTVPFKYSDSIRSVLKVDFFPVDDAGHLPMIEQADLVNEKIGAFLRGR